METTENLAELEKDGLHDHVDALSKSRLWLNGMPLFGMAAWRHGAWKSTSTSCLFDINLWLNH